ncbi:DnaB-like helicase C-terminal domain-containing protein [Xanthomonas phage JGB6]|nr:DnaB-like helicase C-terminal domain-containing protein [Xanthomonas phage JGB6]
MVKAAFEEELKDCDYVLEKVTSFARKQALTQAILTAAAKIDKNDFEGVEELVTKATLIGQHEDAEQYDFWAEADSRMAYRKAIIAGTIKPSGITTGFREVDDIMYHKG